ncbi:MAG TPA: thiazole synthase [bacterium]|nr:thiazole synthase [bacterium]
MEDKLKIGKHTFGSRLFVGTGKYPDFPTMKEALAASGSELVTFAVRRVNIDNPNEESLLDYIDKTKFTLLPNTAGCATAEEAVRVAHIARAAGMTDLIKLEVINDSETLLPDVVGTIEAAKVLAAEGFTVMAYTSSDPVVAGKLIDAGAAAVMPLASPIGSGRGFIDFSFIQLVIKRYGGVVPIVVDAGLGVPSDAAQAMEIGADAVLINTAIAKAKDPVKMALAMKLGVEAGRLAYSAGRISRIDHASPSSPVEGVIK